MIIWYTGLSGSGKSTIAKRVAQRLLGVPFNLDGDVMRKGLNSDLGFSMEDRTENIRRLAHLAKYLSKFGDVQVPVIAPLISHRDLARSIIGKENFRLVYIATTIQLCESRDVKGLYRKEREGEITGLTGISSPYDVPYDYDLCIDTHLCTIGECAKEVINMLWL